MQSGEKTFVATPLEIYAQAVWERVGEVDNCLESMRIAISEISTIASASPASAPKLYRYHYENFLLRLSGIVDRAYRVVGAVIEVPAKQLNTAGTNLVVRKAVEKKNLSIHASLLSLDKLLSEKKAMRNEVAHAAAYSSRELGLFTAAEHLKHSPLDQSQIQVLMKAHFTTEVGWLGVLTAQAEASVYCLIEELSPLILARSRDGA